MKKKERKTRTHEGKTSIQRTECFHVPLNFIYSLIRVNESAREVPRSAQWSYLNTMKFGSMVAFVDFLTLKFLYIIIRCRYAKWQIAFVSNSKRNEHDWYDER